MGTHGPLVQGAVGGEGGADILWPGREARTLCGAREALVDTLDLLTARRREQRIDSGRASNARRQLLIQGGPNGA
jgi:hypothetical protein